MAHTQQTHASSDFGAGARAVLTIAEQVAAALEATPDFSVEREGYAVAALRGLIRAGEQVTLADGQH